MARAFAEDEVAYALKNQEYSEERRLDTRNRV
jgi:hypothetical protein